MITIMNNKLDRVYSV